nr:MAG TPA: hypothetical protein [Caudoviricetes sp.]
MSKLQALATLVGMSKEYEEEIHYLEEALQCIRWAKQRIHQSCNSWGVDSADPDDSFWKKNPFQCKAILNLDAAEERINKFTEGILKYE